MAAPLNTTVPADGAATGSRPANGEGAVLGYVREAVSGAATLLQEVPVVAAVCATFLSFEKLAETATNNKEELLYLRDLCDLVVKFVLQKFPDRSGVRNGFEKLEEHMKKAEDVARRCNEVGFREGLKRPVLARKIASVQKSFVDFSTLNNFALTNNIHEARRNSKGDLASIRRGDEGARRNITGDLAAITKGNETDQMETERSLSFAFEKLVFKEDIVGKESPEKADENKVAQPGAAIFNADPSAQDFSLVTREATMTRSLGRGHAIYASTSHGVELEVQAGSLIEEVYRSVTVSPRLQFVECRTEGLGRAPSHEDCFKEEFLAMTFVHGPEEASFLEEKPAKLRFFLGYVDDFAPGDGSDRVIGNEDIKTYILETHRPLTSPNGVDDWTVLGTYSVVFRPVLEDQEVWVETTLRHFSIVANGIWVRQEVVPDIPGYHHTKRGTQPYYKGYIGGLFGTLKRKANRTKATPMVRFGNATQEYATFTYYPRIEQTMFAQGSERNGEMGVGSFSVGAGTGQRSSVEGIALQVAQRPLTKIVRAGHYEDCEMPCGLSAHQQMNVRVGVIENLTGENVRTSTGTLQVLDEELISGNRLLVLRPNRLEMPCELTELLSWPCSAITIMNHMATV